MLSLMNFRRLWRRSIWLLKEVYIVFLDGFRNLYGALGVKPAVVFHNYVHIGADGLSDRPDSLFYYPYVFVVPVLFCDPQSFLGCVQ